MDTWTPDIKLEKKSYQIMLTERIPGQKAINRLVTIENGEIIEKPDDVRLLGTLTSDGFVVTGLQIIKDDSGKAKCIICDKEYDIYQLYISDNHPWKKVCQVCWDLPSEEKQKAFEEYRKKIFK